MDSFSDGRLCLTRFFIPLAFLVSFTACQSGTPREGITTGKDTLAQSKSGEPPKTWMPALDSGKKTIYLTFDDGPNFGSGPVMQIARQEQVPVTFFTIGVHVHGSPIQERYWKEMHNDKLFELCNHSYTHAFWNRYNTFYSNPDTVLKDFRRNEDSGGFNNKILRTPGNNIWRMPRIQNDTKMAKNAGDLLFKSGYTIMGWDNEWTYAGRSQKLLQTPEKLYQEIEYAFANQKTKVPNHLILLTHDLTFHDPVDSGWLHQFIKMLKANPNYQMAFASQYPGLK